MRQRSRILELIRKDFTKICCDQRGTHTIQTIFDTVSLPDEEKYIEQVLRGKISFLSMDQQGTHVVQKVLQSQILKNENGAFIFDEIYENLNELCVNRNGLCVIKILVEKTTSRPVQSRLMSRIQGNVIKLVSDPFGNYAISEILTNWPHEVCVPIYEKLMSKISELSI